MGWRSRSAHTARRFRGSKSPAPRSDLLDPGRSTVHATTGRSERVAPAGDSAHDTCCTERLGGERRPAISLSAPCAPKCLLATTCQSPPVERPPLSRAATPSALPFNELRSYAGFPNRRRMSPRCEPWSRSRIQPPRSSLYLALAGFIIATSSVKRPDDSARLVDRRGVVVERVCFCGSQTAAPSRVSHRQCADSILAKDRSAGDQVSSARRGRGAVGPASKRPLTRPQPGVGSVPTWRCYPEPVLKRGPSRSSAVLRCRNCETSAGIVKAGHDLLTDCEEARR